MTWRERLAGVALALALALPAGPAAAVLADAAPPIVVAVLPIEVVDTSGEAANPQWPERIAAVTGSLARALSESGRYRAIDLTPEQDRLAPMAPIHRCNGCWLGVVRATGADAVAITVVHKMSTLIASMHVWVLDAATQRIIRQGAVSLRGDSGEAWERAAGFLVRKGIAGEDQGRPMLSSPFPGG
jgi:hypothetical protein